VERRIGIEIYENNNYPIKTKEYIRGVLHTYAELNQPNSNLAYEYEIVEFEKSENITEVLQKKFYIFENQQIELNEISKVDFLEILKAWFFCNGEVNNLNISEYQKYNKLKYFSKLIEDILNVEKYFKVDNLMSENEIAYLELGIYYDYLVLKSTEKNFILYFKYID
jgi:hypothetical protein